MQHLSLDLSAGPLWLLILALLVATGLAIWTYQHTIPATTPSKRRLLITLRSLGLAALLFALFGPIFSSTSTHDATPTVALVLDRSQSMQLASGRAGSISRAEAMLKSIHDQVPSDLLNDKAKLDLFQVGDATELISNARMLDSVRPTASVTNLASVFDAIRETRRTKNTEAIILYTDGAFTAGINPIYPAEQLGVPIYAIGLGDSAEPRDVALTELFTNDLATLGTPQPVDITLHYSGAKAGEQVTVTLFDEAEKIGEKQVLLREGTVDEAVAFSLTPKTEGIHKLSARVTTIEGETTEKNNLRLAYVHVLKNKFHVLLFAGAPSSDVAFLRSYFEAQPSVELTTFIQKKGAEFYEGVPDRAKLKQVDLVVLLGFPVAATSEQSIGMVKQLLTTEARPLLFVPSHELDAAKLALFGDAIPFRIAGASRSQNELKVSMNVNPSALDDPILHIPEKEKSSVNWMGLAPLFKSEAHIEARPEAQVLAEATIQGVKLGEPLLISRRLGATRQIALTGYGLWQWKLISFGRDAAYRATSRTKDTSNVVISALDLFMGNASRWLTTQDESKRVKIEPSRKFYEAGERIDFMAQIYDESYLPIERATVTARISGPAIPQPLELTLDDRTNGRYSAEILRGLPAGDYTYTGTASLNGKALGTDQGRFNVGEFNVEFAEPRMRNDILRQMAERTGGKFYTPETAGSLMKDLKANPRFKPTEISNKHDYELWNSWPLLLFALACLGTEWFVRKRAGML